MRDAAGVIVRLSPYTPNAMSLIPYTKGAIAIIKATSKTPKKGEIKAMPAMTTVARPRQYLLLLTSWVSSISYSGQNAGNAAE
ncbi:hypothetical protein Ngar_c23650 [Candidatus Nitrososphaera gargensis Ga9.2]|uniref:Uncharacterized protein n=1 Tax=Nitrososphaera gargensis (strain Ga9.2) TaxID=1237085 RepID=K0IHA3_NITGG|nr:hypothetical protein Ngar_c23650 [Candidatus Nitrososphaera gargensis Ga9.2]